MQLSCPECGTRDVRASRPRSAVERIKLWFGLINLRCRSCRARWSAARYSGGEWKYAECPRCFRQDLETWIASRFAAPFWMRLKIAAGARRYRCHSCRCNFATFRTRKPHKKTGTVPRDADETTE